MKEFLRVTKSADEEHPVPTEWRKTLTRIVEAFRSRDFKIEQGIPGVLPLSEREAERIAGNIASYGHELSSLPGETWNTSIYRWMGGYWEVLVDLFTIQEGQSDLVLFVRVYERNYSYEFEVESVNVP